MVSVASLKRGGVHSEEYRTGYLRSRAWFWRRDAFLEMVVERDGFLACACCMERMSNREMQVHHLDYEGVNQRKSGDWVAREPDDDLVQLCPWCHEQVHLLMDSDPGWSRRSRRAATWEIIRRIQLRLAAAGVASLKQIGVQ